VCVAVSAVGHGVGVCTTDDKRLYMGRKENGRIRALVVRYFA
jgi:hypothetical protein